MSQNIKIIILLSITMSLFGCGSGSKSDSKKNSGINSNNPDYEKYVAENYSEITSLIDDENYDDLQQLSEKIGSHRIVQLGESTHGSKQMNQVKTRLIKYLHQYHDFNVISFESSAFSCNMQLEKNENIDAESLTKSCVYGIWRTKEVKELFAYILQTQSTDRPLHLSGFDIKFSSNSDNKENLIEFYSKTAEQYGLINSVDIDGFAELIVSYNNARKGCYVNDNSQDCAFLKNSYSDSRVSIEVFRDSFLGDEPQLQLARIIANSYLFLIEETSQSSIDVAIYIRDQGMAETFTELATYYWTEEKVIVWAHNAHVAESNYSQDSELGMGYYLDDYWQDELYTIGLYMIKGESANNYKESIKVTSHAINSLEILAQSVNKGIIFLPFTSKNEPGTEDDWLHVEATNKHWGVRNQQTILADAYDAVIVIENSTIPDYLN